MSTRHNARLEAVLVEMSPDDPDMEAVLRQVASLPELRALIARIEVILNA